MSKTDRCQRMIAGLLFSYGETNEAEAHKAEKFDTYSFARTQDIVYLQGYYANSQATSCI